MDLLDRFEVQSISGAHLFLICFHIELSKNGKPFEYASALDFSWE
jgi:hypothetical protein